jgi:hypothetical protein
MLVSVADLVKIPYEKPLPIHKHYVNHLAWSPDGKRILMFHRWVGSGGSVPVWPRSFPLAPRPWGL